MSYYEPPSGAAPASGLGVHRLDGSGNEPLTTPAIIGVVIGVVGGVILAAGLAIYCRYRNLKKFGISPLGDGDEMDTEDRPVASAKDQGNGAIELKNELATGSRIKTTAGFQPESLQRRQ